MVEVEGEVDSAGTRIHYTRTGAGAGAGVPLVLLHGFTDAGRNWARTAERLARGYDIVMPDMRGHGLSAAPAVGYAAADLAADLAAVVRALGLQRPALMGHSLGASTVAWAAATGLVGARCLVLEDPPWRAPGPPVDAAVREKRLADRRAEFEAQRALPVAELERVCLEQHPGWDRRDARLWAESKLLVRREVAEVARHPMPQDHEVAPSISCPVLLLTGDNARGAIVSPEIAERFRAALASRGVPCEVARLEAGHSIRRERFEEATGLVESFLQRYAR